MLAQYSALMVMEHQYGRAQMRRFLKQELDGYLSGRGGEAVEELPLYCVENQQYIHYEKGSLVFYRLREEMGEAALNRALKRFLQDKGYQQSPCTTSAALLDYLRAEATPSQQALITDLFEKISFYDNRVQTATARRRNDGKYEVTLDLFAAKRYAAASACRSETGQGAAGCRPWKIPEGQWPDMLRPALSWPRISPPAKVVECTLT